MSGKSSKLLTLTPQFSTWREYYTNLFHNKGIDNSFVDNLLYHNQLEAFVELICFVLDRPNMTNEEFSAEFLRTPVNTSQLTPGFRSTELEFCLSGLLFSENRHLSPNTDLLYRILTNFVTTTPPYEIIDVFRILRSRAEWYSGDEFRQAYQNSPLHAYKAKIASLPYHLISLETPQDYIGAFTLQLTFGIQTQQIENRRGIRRIDPLYTPGDNMNNWLGTADDSKTFYDVVNEDTPTLTGIHTQSHWVMMNQRLVLEMHHLLASVNLDGYYSVFGADSIPVKVAQTDSPYNPPSPHPYLPKICLDRLIIFEMHIVRLCHSFLFYEQINTITQQLLELGDNGDNDMKDKLEKELFVYNEYQSNAREMFLYFLLHHGIYLFTPFQIAISYVIARHFNDEELLTLFKTKFDVDENNWYCYTAQKRQEMIADPELDVFYNEDNAADLFPRYDADVTPVTFLSGALLHFCRLKPIFQPLFKFLIDNTKEHSPQLFPSVTIEVNGDDKKDDVVVEDKKDDGEDKKDDVVVEDKKDDVVVEDKKDDGEDKKDDVEVKPEEAVVEPKNVDDVDGIEDKPSEGDDVEQVTEEGEGKSKDIVADEEKVPVEEPTPTKVEEDVIEAKETLSATPTPAKLTIDEYPELNWFFSKLQFTFHDLLPLPDGQNYVRYFINNRSIVSSTFELIFSLPDDVLQILMGVKNDMNQVFASCFKTLSRGAARIPEESLKWVKLLVGRYRQYQANQKNKAVVEKDDKETTKDGAKGKKGTGKGKKVSMMDKMKGLAAQSQKAPELKFELDFIEYLGLIQRYMGYYSHIHNENGYNEHVFDFIQYVLDENLILPFEKSKTPEVQHHYVKLAGIATRLWLQLPTQWQLQVKKAHCQLLKLATPPMLDTIIGSTKEPIFGEPFADLIVSGQVDVVEHICTTFQKHFKIANCGLYFYVLLWNKMYNLRDYMNVPDIDVLLPQSTTTEFDATTTTRFSIYKPQQLLQFLPQDTISDDNLRTLFPGFFNYHKQSNDNTTVKLYDIKSSFERYSPPTFEIQFPKLNPAYMAVQIGLYDMTFGDLMESAGTTITPGEPQHMAFMDIIRRRTFGFTPDEPIPGSFEDDNTIRTKHVLTVDEFSALERPQCPWGPFLHMNAKPMSFNNDTNQIIYSTPQVRQYKSFDNYGSPLHFYSTTTKPIGTDTTTDDNDTNITFYNKDIIVSDEMKNLEEVRNAQFQRGANYLIKLFELNNNIPDPEMRSPSLSIIEHMYYAFHPNEINFKKKYANRASKWKNLWFLTQGDNLTKDNYVDMTSWITNTTPLLYNIAKGFQPQIFQNELYISGAFTSSVKQTKPNLLTQRGVFTTEIINILGAADNASDEYNVDSNDGVENLQPVDKKLQLYTICEKYATFITNNKDTQAYLQHKSEYLSFCYNEELNPGFKVKPIFSLLQLNTSPTNYDLTKFSFQSPHVDEEGGQDDEQQQDNDEDDEYYTAPTPVMKDIQPLERTGLISFNGYDADHIVSRYRHYLINAPTYLVWDFQQFINSPTIESLENPLTREHPIISASPSNPNDSHLDKNIIEYNIDQYSIINCLATTIDQYGCVIGQAESRSKIMEYRQQMTQLYQEYKEDPTKDHKYPTKQQSTYTKYYPSDINWLPYLYQHCHGGQHIPHFIIYSFGFWMALPGFALHSILPDLQLHLLNGSLQLYDRQEPRSLILSPQFNIPFEDMKLGVGLCVTLFHVDSHAGTGVGELIERRVELFMKAMQTFGQEVQDNEEKEKAAAETEQKLNEATSSSLTTMLGIGAVIGSAIAIGTGLYFYFTNKSNTKTTSTTTTSTTPSITIEEVKTETVQSVNTPQ